MMPETNKNYLFSFAIIFAASIMMMLIFLGTCNTEKQPSISRTIDSLNFIRAIEKKQAGKEIAILLNEVTQLERGKAKDNAATDSIKQHEKSLMATNAYLIKKMRENAPKDCQPYIDSTNEYHRQIEEVKDAAFNSQSEELAKADSSNVKLKKVVEKQAEEAVKDSTNYAANIQDKDKQIAKSNKKLHRAKVINKIVGILSAAAVIFSFSFVFGR